MPIIYVLWLPFRLKSIKAIEIESRERLDARLAAKLIYFGLKLCRFAEPARLISLAPAMFDLNYWCMEEVRQFMIKPVCEN